MTRRSAPILSLVIVERRLLVAELAGRGATEPRRGEAWSLPEGVTMDQPRQVGQGLRAFLKEKGFVARDVVVGIPGRWVLAQEREVPPAPAAQVAALLRIQAEKLAVSDAADLVFDYAGKPSHDAPTRVLLAGTLKKRLDQIDEMAQAAGLKVRSVTPTLLAAAQVVGGDRPDTPMMLLSEGGADVLWRAGGRPRRMQHVAVSLNGHGRTLDLLGAELRRGLALNPAGTGNGQREAIVIDAAGLHFNEARALANDSGLSFLPSPASEAHTPAGALALAAARGNLAVDFKHSRLALPPRRRFGRRVVWTAVLALLVLIAVAIEVAEHQTQRAELAALQIQAGMIAPEVAAAGESLERIDFGRGYFENRPSALACLREVTLAFDPGDPLWITAFSFHENRPCQLNGATTDQRAALALLERLKANPRFRDVTLLDLREAAGTRDRQAAFSITFLFQPGGTP